MANLKEVRLRIASVTSTMQITSAMKLVSAAKIRKTQRFIQTMRPYEHTVKQILLQLLSTTPIDPIYTRKRRRGKVLLVVLSSNKGLCGGFNNNVFKLTEQHLANIKQEYPDEEVEIFSIGKKGSLYFSKRPLYVNTCEQNNQIWDNVGHREAQSVATQLINKFQNEDYCSIDFIYNHFVSTVSQMPMIRNFLPIDPLSIQKDFQTTIDNVDYIVEPNARLLMQQCVKQYLELQVLELLVDSLLAEHAARMTSMHKATDNAQELIKELTLHYNKVRQSTITNEIIEISSSAEALHN